MTSLFFNIMLHYVMYQLTNEPGQVKETRLTKRNGFHEKEWLPVKETSSTKRNGFH